MKAILLVSTIFFGYSLTFSQQIIPIDSLEPNSLNSVTIIGFSIDKPIGSESVINSKLLQKLNQPDINKILATVPGVNIRDEEGFGLRPNIGLRGTPVNRSAKITLMEDGILMAPAPYADPSAYYFPTASRMERIEVLKGSSQIKNGPYTIGGALNLISTSIPDKFKGYAQLSYGSFGTSQQRLWIGDSRKNIDYVFEINRHTSNGFKELDNGANTGFKRRDLMGKVKWHTSEYARIPQSVTLKFVNMFENGNETYLGLTFEDFKKNPNRRYAATQNDLLDLNHQHLSIKHDIYPINNLAIHSTIYLSKTYRDWARINTIEGISLNNILADPIKESLAYNVMTGLNNGNIGFQSAARTYHSKGAQTNLKYKFETKAIKHTAEIGIRYHEDDADRYATQHSYAMTAGNLIQTSAGIKGNSENQIRLAKSFSTFLHYEFNYKNLTITPGIRYENIYFKIKNYGNADFSRTGNALKTATNAISTLLPGIGANYTINSNMVIFGGIHKGFSPPGTPAIGSNNGQATIETAVNYELGYKYTRKNINLQVVGFLNTYNNILGSDNISGGGAGTGNVFNAGKAKINGIELSCEYNLMSLFNKTSSYLIPLNISYTYTDAKFQETFKNAGGDWGTGTINTGDIIPFITPQLFAASIGFETSKMNFTLSSRFTGNTRTKPGQDKEIIPENTVPYNSVNTINKYWVFDISGNYNIYKSLTIFTSINNVFNKKYIVANLPQGYRPGMPLSISLGLKVNL